MASNLPFPHMPPRSTVALFEGFDPAVFTKDANSTIYKYLDALVGTTGAGSLMNQVFLSNLNNAIETCYFNELDYIFGNINFVARTTAESYPYDPLTEQLTSDQWDEVMVKDAWFRARIKDFFAAVQLGCTPEGIRKMVQAALACDCTIMEVWRYADNILVQQSLVNPFPGSGATSDPIGRTLSVNHYLATNLVTGDKVFFETQSAATTFVSQKNSDAGTTLWEANIVRPRNEVVIRPHKETLEPEENRLLREVLSRLLPVDIISNVDLNGLSVSTPVAIAAAAADSTYYEVIKQVTPTPLVSQLPAPEFLPIDLLESEKWLMQIPDPNNSKNQFGRINKVYNVTEPREAPTAAFMSTSQYSYYYLVGGGKRSSVDSVTYGTLQSDGSIARAQNFQRYQQSSTYTDWFRYEKADSPDNYPGGKFGQHPGYAPALNPDNTPYAFSYESQLAFVNEMINKITAMGGIADQNRYKIPIQKLQTAVYTYYPEYAVADFPPAKESTVSASITRQRPKRNSNNVGNPVNFVR